MKSKGSFAMKLIYLGMLFSFIAMNIICMDNMDNPYNNQSIIHHSHHSPTKARNYKRYEKSQHYKECRKNQRAIRQGDKQTLKK